MTVNVIELVTTLVHFGLQENVSFDPSHGYCKQ